MKTTVIGKIPPSQSGQFLRERHVSGNIVVREILQTVSVDPRSLIGPGMSLWAGRYGGWVRMH